MADLIVEAFIEIPKNSSTKYEYDKAKRVFRLDRVLHSPIHYPTDYGFIPDTLAEDGDPLDIMVLLSQPTFPGCLVPARVIGALQMTDDKGLDTKVLGVFPGDPRFHEVRTMDDVQPHVLKEIEYFFGIYKELEGKHVHVEGWEGFDFAAQAVERAIAAYARKKG